MRSIERLLLVWVLSAMTLGAAAMVGASYWLTLDELDEVFDENLKQVTLAAVYHHSIGSPLTTARVSSSKPASTPASGAEAGPVRASGGAARTRPPLPRLPQIYDSEGEFDFVTQVWMGDGTLLFTSDPTVSIPFMTQTGIRHLTRPDGEWHIFSIAQPDVVVQTAQREVSRKILAAEAASKMFAPLAALVVLIGASLVFALRRGLRPLDDAAASVAQRTANTMQPVSLVNMPREIHPLVHSINDLLSRLSVAFVTQRRFVADAAHELRTPVTALRLQLQLLERARDEAARNRAIGDLREGIERSQHLIEQLLHLSRVEPDASDSASQRTATADAAGAADTVVDLGDLVRGVVGNMSIKAEHQGIDLGAEADTGISVRGNHDELLILLNNLVENALRYTPRGGVVDVRATRAHQKPMLQVIDSGPGVPYEERKRVFDRFYRGEARHAGAEQSTGSGLGLAIVKAIAERHGADVSLHTAPGGSGLEARVVFADR